MAKERIQYLLQVYTANQASREEVEELFAWLKKQEGEDALKTFIVDAAGKEEQHPTLPQSEWDNIWHSIQSASTEKTPAKIIRPFGSSRLARIAATVLLFVMAGSA